MILRPQHILRSTDAFNATTSDINFGVQASSQNPTAQSILAYVYPAGAGENNTGKIFQKSASGVDNGVRLHIGNNSGNPTFTFGADSTGIPLRPFRISASNTVPYNNWYHLGAIWAGGATGPLGNAMRLFLGKNGEVLSEPSYSTSEDGDTAALYGANDPIHIGNREGTDRTFNGTIAYVARWDRMLTMPELWTAQRYGPLAVPRGLILCWANGRDYGPYGIMPTSKTALQGGMMPGMRALGYQRTSWMIQAQAAGGVEIAPGFGNLILTGYEPTVSATDGTRAISTGLGELTITGYEPTVSYTENKFASPELGELVITGYAPTVGQGYTVTPGLGELVLTGYAPTVSRTEHVIVNPETGALIITGYEPTALVEGSWTVSTDLGNLILTGYAPSVVISGEAEAAVGQTPAGSSKRRQDYRRRRIMLPDGTLIWATFDEAYDIVNAFATPAEKPKAKGKRGQKSKPRETLLPLEKEDITWTPVQDTAMETYKPILPQEWRFEPQTREYRRVILELMRRMDDEEAITLLLLH